eukprot:c24982_g1_i1 orf=634-927(-)
MIIICPNSLSINRLQIKFNITPHMWKYTHLHTCVLLESFHHGFYNEPPHKIKHCGIKEKTVEYVLESNLQQSNNHYISSLFQQVALNISNTAVSSPQ